MGRLVQAVPVSWLYGFFSMRRFLYYGSFSKRSCLQSYLVKNDDNILDREETLQYEVKQIVYILQVTSPCVITNLGNKEQEGTGTKKD